MFVQPACIQPQCEGGSDTGKPKSYKNAHAVYKASEAFLALYFFLVKWVMGHILPGDLNAKPQILNLYYTSHFVLYAEGR